MTHSRLSTARSCRKYVRSLHLDPYSDAYELAAQIGARRSRPLRVVRWRLPIPGPMGIWVGRAHDDVVIIQSLANAGHQQHILLHELAHIVCEHTGEPPTHIPPELPEEFGKVGTVRFRSVYDCSSERDAEMLAAAFAENTIAGLNSNSHQSEIRDYFDGI